MFGSRCASAKMLRSTSLPPSISPLFISPSRSLPPSTALALFLTVTHMNRWAHWWGPTRLATVTMKTKMSNSAVSASSPEIDERNVSFLILNLSRLAGDRWVVYNTKDIHMDYDPALVPAEVCCVQTHTCKHTYKSRTHSPNEYLIADVSLDTTT
jgi:hypothetical protein